MKHASPSLRDRLAITAAQNGRPVYSGTWPI
jgi:hypothetical protein